MTTIEVNVELSTMIAFARNAFAEDDAAGEQIITAVAETRASVRASTAVRGATAAESRAAIFAGDALAKGSYMASPIWIGGVTTSGLGIAHRFKLARTEALTTAGWIVTAVGFLLSAYQWYDDSVEGKDTKADAAATIGSALLFASMFAAPFAPALDADFFYVDDSQRDLLSKLVESPAEVDMLLGR